MKRSLAARAWALLALLWAVACGASPADGQVEHVRAVQWSKLANGPALSPGDDFGEKLVRLLQLESRYVLREIVRDFKTADDLPEFPGLEYYYPFGHHESTEYSIRPLGDFALGIAVMLKTGIYSRETAKLDEAEALRRVELAIRGVAMTHRANRLKGRNWGGRGRSSSCWQAAYWASLAAEAAWMLWDDLTDDTHRVVVKMVTYEADSFRDYRVPYWKDFDGNEIHPGDSKSEENAWNARLLAVAQAMMPDHPNVALWRQKASELQVSAYSRPSDRANAAIIDGRPVREWIKGSNIAEDGVVVNHSMIQPDYTACDAELRGSTVIVASMAGQRIPESTLFNAKFVFSALTEVEFKPGPSPYGKGKIVAPGGTIYVRSGHGTDTVYSARVFYPQGADWVRDDIAIIMSPHLNMDLYAEIFAFDVGKDFDAMGWAQKRVDRLLEMQQRSGDAGMVYQPGDWPSDYYSTEQVIFETNAEAWLLWWLHKHGRISPIGSGWGPLTAKAASDKIN